MKRIPATLGYEAIVDDEDFERLSKFRWYAHNSGGRTRRPEKRPARRTLVNEGRKVRFLVHDILMPPPGMVVDHINGDPWDNRRCNLRVCTHTENLRNRKKHRGSSPYKGVTQQQGGRFIARISAERRGIHLGTFPTAEAAARAYDAAATVYHGEFARLNFPDSAPSTISGAA